jgi:hypothetical protein
MGKTPGAAAADRGVEASFAAAGDPRPVAQILEEPAGSIDILQPFLHEISCDQGHPAAGADIAIRQNGNERISCRAAVGPLSGNEKLQRSLKSYPLFSEPPSPLLAVHEPDELPRLVRSEQAMLFRSTTAAGHHTVGPDPAHAEFRTQLCHMGEIPEVIPVSREGDMSWNTRIH